MITPLLIGILGSFSITREFSFFGFLLIFIVGMSIQISMHVYNDIYDTIQGADDKISQQHEFSGGSGILLDHPELKYKMFFIARTFILLAFLAGIILLFLIDNELRILLIVLIAFSAFLSKYYTAPPFKLAYRGLGEIAVWIAFGPVVVLFGSISQNLGPHPTILALMPITGFITLSIAWVGEIVDFDSDIAADKLGLVFYLGRQRSIYVSIIIHILAIFNVIYVALYVLNPGFPIMFAMVPPALMITRYSLFVRDKTFDRDFFRNLSKMNYNIVVLFSICLIIGFSSNILIDKIF